MCKYCDLKKSERYGGIHRGATMAWREFFEACRDVPTKEISIFIGENDMCSSGLGLYLDEGSMANVIGLRHTDSVSVNFCFHCGKSAKGYFKENRKGGEVKKKKGASDIVLGCIMAFGILFIFASVCMFVGSVALGAWGWMHG